MLSTTESFAYLKNVPGKEGPNLENETDT